LQALADSNNRCGIVSFAGSGSQCPDPQVGAR